jgi:formylglycine-generating enzyme required for sulfatase activity
VVLRQRSLALGDYAWFKDNADGKSHPVGQKKPNPWGLYDIYGNVCERISDKYSRSYYSISPKVDPTGPSQGTKSRFEYTGHRSAIGQVRVDGAGGHGQLRSATERRRE